MPEGRDANATVFGEEQSHRGSGDRMWVIDPVDGTGEYVDDSIDDYARTTCIGISLFWRGQQVLSVVYNPFRNELFTARFPRPTQLNGQVAHCSRRVLAPGMPYDYVHWDGARFNLPRLEAILGRPMGVYSAIYQACMVAAGHSAFAAFPGDTIHDIAPGALLVTQAGGRVTDFQGNPLSWDRLNQGVLYANSVCHAQAVRVLRSL